MEITPRSNNVVAPKKAPNCKDSFISAIKYNQPSRITNFIPIKLNSSRSRDIQKFFPIPSAIFNFAAPAKVPTGKNNTNFDHSNNFYRTSSFGELQAKTHRLSISQNTSDQHQVNQYLPNAFSSGSSGYNSYYSITLRMPVWILVPRKPLTSIPATLCIKWCQACIQKNIWIFKIMPVNLQRFINRVTSNRWNT